MNDLKCTNTEIETFKKRIDIIKKDTDNVKKSFSSKKKASDVRIFKSNNEHYFIKPTL